MRYHLAEVEARNLHVAPGYSSMYAYCSEALHLTDHEAFNRIEVARAGRRFPVILDRLAEGAVSLTAVRLPRADGKWIGTDSRRRL